MSFGFSIGDFLAVIELVKKVRKDFREAPTQLEHVAKEVRNLSNFLQDAEVSVSDDFESELSDQQKEHLKQFTGSCREVLLDLQQTLGKYKDLETEGGTLGRRVKRVWKRLEFEPDDIRQLRDRLTSTVTTLTAFNTQVASRAGLATRKGVGRLNQRGDDEERLKVLNWLTPTDYAAQQSDYIDRRQPGTGQWLLDSPEFQTWMQGDKQTLFCPGIPGAGKTILTSIVVGKLLNDFEDDKTIGVAYIYCNYKRAHEQQLNDLISSLVKQLSGSQSTLPDGVQLLYDRHKDRRTRPSFDELSNALRSVVLAYSKVFVVVDALDECQVANGCRQRLLTEIFHLAIQSQTSFFATSRFIPEITEKFTGMTRLEIRANSSDVQRYVEGHISGLPSFLHRDPILQGEVATEIIKAVDGMFLLAQLHLDSLVGMRSVKALKKALTKLPSGSEAYDASYKAAMERIQGQLAPQTKLAMEVLSWITFAKRPLTTIELQHALAVELGETQLDEENITELEDMVSVCAGLVTVDEQSSVIRLVHYTTQEYFKRTGAHWFPNAEFDITKTCITYMSFDAFSCGSSSPDELTERFRLNPLYRYATRNWAEHARHDSRLGQDVVEFLLHKAKHVQASGQALRHALGDEGIYRVPDIETGLHLAAALGYEKAVEALVQAGVDPDSAHVNGTTPLSMAAFLGHEATVKLLLDTGKVDVDSGDKDGRTPLIYAAGYGYEAIVKLLLDTGKVDVDSGDKNGRTPLIYAVERGHEAIVKLLLDTGKVDVDSRDEDGRKPLILVAITDQENTVSFLVESGSADVNAQDRTKRTALSYGARNGSERIADILLSSSSVNPDLKDLFDSTPLMIATRNHRIEVARQLMETGRVDLDSRDCFGRSPLWYAKRYGYDDIAELLLQEAKRSGVSLSHNDLPEGVCSQPRDTRYRWCEICTMDIGGERVLYHCPVCICIYGDFRVCQSCYEAGGRCLQVDHELVRYSQYSLYLNLG